MRVTSDRFVDNARHAQGDADLMGALRRLGRDSRASRRSIMDRLPEFDALRDASTSIKDHALRNLDFYLEHFEGAVTAAGGQVHWCRNADEACATVVEICRRRGATKVAKGKSMISEEIGLNDYLHLHGVEPVETDLGEYIVQLRDETPSHIVMPAIHLTKDQIADTFRERHGDLDPARPLDQPRRLTDEARAVLRDTFTGAEIGITGANFLIAETGSAVVVTNEGNGDLVATLPPVHIVLASIEKVVPAAEDAFALLRVLARSATGQEITCYTSFFTGPRRQGDRDGPEEFHVVLLDNGRSELLGGDMREALRCIRCGACQSLCPVYGAIGGHAYGWVYAGPIGAVLTPALAGLEVSYRLPEASTLCGNCEHVCPVRIPLPALMRRWRERAFEAAMPGALARYALALWGLVALRPALYRLVTRVAVFALALAGRRKGRFRRLPFFAAWTATRDLPAPEGSTFMDRWGMERRGMDRRGRR